MGIRKIDYEVCDGCRQCTRICPEDVLRFDQENHKPLIQYLRDCQACFLCEIYCPRQAIYVTPYRERRAVMPW
ncbi:ferredoxin family protein [Moorella naiadis]|uniref:4Fe-4S dicluster domain-containing protein n=1 Tax=Moorella naiadis (nom. illeg.) TaxID=3093670 RepID=UPI003D9C9860